MGIRRVDTAKGHYYRDDKGRVPGVTTILEALPKDALINWAANTTAGAAVNRWEELTDMPPAQRLKTLQGARYEEKDKAAKRGTEIHGYGERLVKGETVNVPDELVGYVEGYARFLDAFRVAPVAVEFVVHSNRYRYAGTGDLVADLWDAETGHMVRWLLDLKSNRSGIYAETALQLAAYRYADVWMYGDTDTDRGTVRGPVQVARCGAVHVTPTGAHLVPLTVDEQQFRQFLYVQQTWEWKKHDRDLVGAPIPPPTSSRYRLVQEDQQ